MGSGKARKTLLSTNLFYVLIDENVLFKSITCKFNKKYIVSMKCYSLPIYKERNTYQLTNTSIHPVSFNEKWAPSLISFTLQGPNKTTKWADAVQKLYYNMKQ